MKHQIRTFSVGKRLKRLRLENGLGLEELALKTKLSSNVLRRIEENHTLPPLETLYRLSGFFSCPLSYFFGRNHLKPQYTVIRKPNRRIIYSKNNDVRMELLTDTLCGMPGMEVFLLNLKPKAVYEKNESHCGEEAIIVCEGEIEVQIKEKREVLRKGDAITYSCRQTHTIKARGRHNTRLIIAVTPPKVKCPKSNGDGKEKESNEHGKIF